MKTKRLQNQVAYYKDKVKRLGNMKFYSDESDLIAIFLMSFVQNKTEAKLADRDRSEEHSPHTTAVIHSIRKNKAQPNTRGRRYNNVEMTLAIGSLNVSKKCHRFISKNIMPLPSITTVRKLTSTLMEKVHYTLVNYCFASNVYPFQKHM